MGNDGQFIAKLALSAAKPRIQIEEGEAALESWDTLEIQYNYCICILEVIGISIRRRMRYFPYSREDSISCWLD